MCITGVLTFALRCTRNEYIKCVTLTVQPNNSSLATFKDSQKIFLGHFNVKKVPRESRFVSFLQFDLNAYSDHQCVIKKLIKN